MANLHSSSNQRSLATTISEAAEASTQKVKRVANILSSKWTRRDDGGTPVTQQHTATGSSVDLPDSAKQFHVNEQRTQQIRRGSLRGTEEPEFVDTKDLEADDIVIAVMGPTGSGKSTFVSAASGHDTKGIGHKLRSFTDQVSSIKFWDQESMQHVVLVDTPGFDDTTKSDFDILGLISDWLVSSYNKKKLLSGILYLHRITDNRVAGSSLKNLRLFRKLCGGDALDKVYLTTTMWDEVELSVGERRLAELKTQYWKTLISRGAQVARCRSDDGSPKKLIRQIIHSECGTPPLQSHSVEISQGPSSYLQEKPQRYDVLPSRTPTAQQQVENRQGLSSHSQEKPQSYGGEPPAVDNMQEEALRNDAVHGGTLVPPHSPRQIPSSHSQEERQRYDNHRGPTRTTQEPAVESKHRPSSHPQPRSRTYDVAHGDIATSQPQADRQGPSPQSRNMEKSAHMRQETAPVSIQAAEESKAVNTRSQETDNVLAAAMGLKKGTEPHGKVLLIQDEIAELKKELKETAAGQQLYSQLETLVEKQLELLRRIEKEKKAASDPRIVQDLQIEYDDLRAQIDDKLRQMQQLKLPWLKRFFSRRRD